MRELIARLRDWLRRDRLDVELADELRFHSEMLSRDARSSGVKPADAPYAARRALGNVTSVREATRDRWSVPWLDHFQQDARYALRGLRRSSRLHRGRRASRLDSASARTRRCST